LAGCVDIATPARLRKQGQPDEKAFHACAAISGTLIAPQVSHTSSQIPVAPLRILTYCISYITMRFTYSLAAAALVSVAQAHFTLEYPAPRGEFDEDGE
jgi:hypothetical protein